MHVTMWTKQSRRAMILPAGALAGIVVGLLVRLFVGPNEASVVWLVALAITGLPVLVRTADAVVHGRFATDVVAALAIGTALALREPLAGLIVVLMQTGGEALERYAEGRASDAVRALEEGAPRIAHRISPNDATVEDIVVDAIRIGDRLLVRPGEQVPCDGTVIDGKSTLDTSRLTGEAMPREAGPHAHLLSGMINLEGALVIDATAVSSESQYARIVELVRSAEASKSPLQRLADRYAGWFTPLTLVVCLVAWFITRDSARVLAILVIATPCPLILATPIAIIGGINRAAKRHIIVRSGTALERLSDAHIAVFDKTGTITEGRPSVSNVRVLNGFDRAGLLRLAGAVEVHAGHLLARSLVEAAERETGTLPTPASVKESPGEGVEGVVEGRRVLVGSRAFVNARLTVPGNGASAALGSEPALRALIAVDGVLAGAVDFDDRIRPGADAMLATLPSLGIRHTVLLSGDHADNVRATADEVGFDLALGELLPADKVSKVAELSAMKGRVLMVGDGTNDAPALSRADVGVALAGHGGGITAQAADVVILIDDLSRVSEAIRIAQRTMRIARQSIGVGLGLSAIGMVAAAFGYVPPVAGAILQEVIDVAVIVNALRARQSA